MIALPLAELLPHAGDMILIDSITSFDDEQIYTRLTASLMACSICPTAACRPGSAWS